MRDMCAPVPTGEQLEVSRRTGAPQCTGVASTCLGHTGDRPRENNVSRLDHEPARKLIRAHPVGEQIRSHHGDLDNVRTVMMPILPLPL
jgi:hypothetical protein